VTWPGATGAVAQVGSTTPSALGWRSLLATAWLPLRLLRIGTAACSTVAECVVRSTPSLTEDRGASPSVCGRVGAERRPDPRPPSTHRRAAASMGWSQVPPAGETAL